jgi:hypothetical protein
LTNLSQDREHNYLSGKQLTKIIPFVIYRAHELCKALGRKLESELRSVVIERLLNLKRARGIRASDVAGFLVTKKMFIERFQNAKRQSRDEDAGAIR